MKHSAIESCFWRRGFWVRIFGYGPHVKLSKGHEPLFSERYGHCKAYYFAGLRFEWLRPVWKREAA